MKKGFSKFFFILGCIYAFLSLIWNFGDKAGFSLTTLIALSIIFFLASYFINRYRSDEEREKDKEIKLKKAEINMIQKKELEANRTAQQKKEPTQAAQQGTVQTDKKAGLFSSSTYCPHCRSLNVSFMQNNKKGFSVGKAVGGAALTGGIGTLAGFAGKKGKNQWHCQNCGKTFETKK